MYYAHYIYYVFPALDGEERVFHEEFFRSVRVYSTEFGRADRPGKKTLSSSFLGGGGGDWWRGHMVVAMMMCCQNYCRSISHYAEFILYRARHKVARDPVFIAMIIYHSFIGSGHDSEGISYRLVGGASARRDVSICFLMEILLSMMSLVGHNTTTDDVQRRRASNCRGGCKEGSPVLPRVRLEKRRPDMGARSDSVA